MKKARPSFQDVLKKLMQSALILLIGMQIQNSHATTCTLANASPTEHDTYPDNEPVSAGENILVRPTRTMASTDIAGCVFNQGKGTKAGVSNGGLYVIESGGVDSTVTIKSGGNQIIKSGGQAYDSIINKGGTQTIEFGGTVTKANITGIQDVSGTSIGSTITAGGSQYVRNKGIAKNTIIKKGATQTIEVGAISGESHPSQNRPWIQEQVDGSIVSGVQEVYGKAYGTLIKAGGIQYLKGGAIAVKTTIEAGGTESIASGSTSTGGNIWGYQEVWGTSVLKSLEKSGIQRIKAGGKSDNQPQTDIDGTAYIAGHQIVEYSGESINSDLVDGGTQTVGGVARAITIMGNAFQRVQDRGLAENTIIKKGGTQTIERGGTGQSTTISGLQNVAGTAGNSKIESGGKQIIDASGSSTSTTIAGTIIAGTTIAGIQEVKGSATNSTITLGGEQSIFSGGTATNTTIKKGGTQTIAVGGLSNDTLINQGKQVVYGTAKNVTITGGFPSEQIIHGTAENTIINAGEQIIEQTGTAKTTTINAGGIQYIKNGGKAEYTTINTNGVQTIDSGGNVENTIINAGANQTIPKNSKSVIATVSGAQTVYGEARDTTIKASGGQVIHPGATNTIARVEGTQEVQGEAISSTIASNGIQTIKSGGIARYTTIEAGGQQDIESGAKVENTIIQSGAQQTIPTGVNSMVATISGTQIVSGTATSSTIESGGTQSVLSKGVAENTTIKSGGTQTVAGIAQNSTIKSGGVQSVLQGGVTEDTVVEGEQTVDGMARRITIKSGGRVLINPEGQIEGNIVNNGQLSINNTGTKTYADTLTGSGILEKKGDGLLILNGTSPQFNGTTKIVEGTIKLGDIDHPQAQLGGNIDVQTKGTLRGHGTVLGDVTNNGTVKPGGTIGKLRVTGNYVQTKDASLIIEMTPQDGPSQLVVSGTAQLNGNLYIVYAPGTYKTGSHTLITAEQGVNGTFSTISHKNDDGKAHEVPYKNNGVDVFFSEDDAPDRNADDPDNHENGQNVHIEGPNTHIYSNLSSFTVLEMQQFANFVMSRRNTQNAYGDGSNDSWARLLGANTRYGNMRSRQQGFMFGIDRMINQTGFGLALAYDETDFSERNSENKGSTNNIRLGIHASRQFGKLIYSGAAIYTHGRTTQNRIVDMVGTATQKHKGHGTAFDFKVSAPFEATNFNLVPYAGISYSSFRGEDFKETGISDVYLLSVTNNKAKSTQFQAGLSLNKKLGQTEDAGLFSLQLGWNHELGSVKRYATTISHPDSTRFRSEGNDLPSNLFSIGAQFQFQPSKFTTVSLGGNYTVGNQRYSQTTLQAKVKYLFH